MRYAVAMAVAACVQAGPALTQDLKDLPSSSSEIKTLTPKQARLLAARGDRFLRVDGLTEITPEVAQALAQHKDWLELNGLTEITPEVARALAQHKDWLSLKGLNELSDQAAAYLVRYRPSRRVGSGGWQQTTKVDLPPNQRRR